MKGFFTQGVAILLREAITLEEVRSLLADFDILKDFPASESWEMSGPGFVIAYRPEVNGDVALDVVPHPWPDDMGDPKASPMRFTAWSTGQFGPFTYPGGLERSLQQSWSWREARDAVQAHTAFLRLKLTYLAGAKPEARVVPEGYSPIPELEFITRLGMALLKAPGAICWFDASGEVVLPRVLVQERWSFARAENVPAVDLWTNVRFFKFDETWRVMDTVGNAQLEVPDLEAVFPNNSVEAQNVDAFLRNATAYLATSRAKISDGDTMDGPGGERWKCYAFPKGLSPPPRNVIRWFPSSALMQAPARLRPLVKT
jgi:hypothetical protein